MQKSDLPQPLQALLDTSKVNMVKIDLSKKANNFVPSVQSKIGGIGYLPVGETYPVKADGTPLVLLAQINFKQLAEQVDISQLNQPLPTQGILQIYIDGQDDDCLYGCDLDNFLPHDKYQVRFWQDDNSPLNINELNKVIEQLKILNIQDFPFNFSNEFLMTFNLNEQSCNVHSIEFDDLFQKVVNQKIVIPSDLSWQNIAYYYLSNNFDGDADDHLETYYNLVISQNHQILGYPNFTQADPRSYKKNLQEHILLFQIETDDDNDIMWGDVGVANFFIHPVDLAKQDFSQLVYNWDCY